MLILSRSESISTLTSASNEIIPDSFIESFNFPYISSSFLSTSILSSFSDPSFSLSPFLFFSIAILLIFSYYLFLRQYFMHRRLRSAGIPGTTFIPIVGDFPKMILAHFKINQMEMLMKSVQKYGNIFTNTLGTSCPRLMINDPDYAAQVFKLETNGLYRRPPFINDLVEPALGKNGLATVHGKDHIRHRRMTSPLFHYNNLQSMVEIMINHTTHVAGQWTKKIKKQAMNGNDQSLVMDLQKEMVELALNSILSCAFGIELETGDDQHEKKIITEPSPSTHRGSVTNSAERRSITYHLDQIFRFSFQRYVLMLNKPILRHLPFPSLFHVRKHKNTLNRIVLEIIQERASNLSKSNCSGKDLLDLLLSTKDTDGKGYSNDEIKDESLNFIFAGHESTGNTIASALLLLLQNPQSFTDLRGELDTILKGSTPQAEQLNKLPILEAVIHETLRLHPPGPYIAREAIQEHVLGGGETGLKPIRVEPGMEVVICCYTMHQSEQYWDNATKFDYTRWMKRHENGRKLTPKHPFIYLPFGTGSRSCIGSNFSLMEAKIVLATLVQQFDFTLLPNQSFAEQMILILKQHNGIKAKVTIRQR